MILSSNISQQKKQTLFRNIYYITDETTLLLLSYFTEIKDDKNACHIKRLEAFLNIHRYEI